MIFLSKVEVTAGAGGEGDCHKSAHCCLLTSLTSCRVPLLISSSSASSSCASSDSPHVTIYSHTGGKRDCHKSSYCCLLTSLTSCCLLLVGTRPPACFSCECKLTNAFICHILCNANISEIIHDLLLHKHQNSKMTSLSTFQGIASA